MSITVDNQIQCLLGGGEGSMKSSRGVLNIAAGQTTGELPVNMHFVDGVQLTPVGSAPDDSEEVYVDEAFTAGAGGFVVPSTGTITITRKTSTTAQSYFYLVTGR